MREACVNRKLSIAVSVLVLLQTIVCCCKPLGKSEAEAHVFADVPARLSVEVIGATVPISSEGLLTVDMDSDAAGVLQAEIMFHVAANVERVKMAVIATDLHMGSSPRSPHIIPVMVKSPSDGAVVQLEHGNAVPGHDSVLAWQAKTAFNNLNGWLSETVEFESGRTRCFDEDVAVTVEYDQTGPDLPPGEYSGWVKLVCLVGLQ
jgi:hypothetical protein